MEDIRKIFDQSEYSVVKWEPYFEIYDRYLSKYRNKNITFVEIGILGGGSLQMWSRYFGNQAKIVGIDIDQKCANIKYKEENIDIVIGDQSSVEFWNKFFTTYPNIDAILDDGGHTMHQQIVTFESVFPKINMDGVFLCEDCHTSYWSSHGGQFRHPSTFIEYSKTYVDVLNNDWHKVSEQEHNRRTEISKDLTSIHYYDSMVVFEKMGKRQMTLVNK